MLTPRKTIDAGAIRAKLDDLMIALRCEPEGVEADPFDDATMASVVSLAEAIQAENAELETLRGRMVRLARQASQ